MGFLAIATVNRKIKLCKEILSSTDNDTEKLSRKESWEEMLFRLTGNDPRICPCCGKGRMVRKGKLLFERQSIIKT